MPRTFLSIKAAMDFVASELVEISADTLVSRVVAVTLLRQAASSSHDWPALSELLRLQLEHVTLDGGDADLNAQLMALARERLESLLQDVERPPAN